MTMNEYQEAAMATCLPASRNHLYMLSGLCEEVGELHGKFAKAVRKGQLVNCYNNMYTARGGMTDEVEAVREAIKKEAGDVAWLLAGFCSVMGWTLDEVCQDNLDKLKDRAGRGVIDGSGDNR